MADTKHGGSVSRYLQHLIDLDMSGTRAHTVRPAIDEPLAVLYGAFIPALRPLMAEWCEQNDVDQALLISDLLAALADYAAEHEHTTQTRRFFVSDHDQHQRTQAEIIERLDQWLAAANSPHELRDVPATTTPGTTADLAAATDWLRTHPDNTRPKAAEVDAFLTAQHPAAHPAAVHRILHEHGVCPVLDRQRKPRPESKPKTRRKAQ